MKRVEILDLELLAGVLALTANPDDLRLAMLNLGRTEDRLRRDFLGFDSRFGLPLDGLSLGSKTELSMSSFSMDGS